MILGLGSRGLRSRSVPARPVPVVPHVPAPPVLIRRGPRTPPVGSWTGPLVGFAVGGLIGSLVLGAVGHGLEAGPVRLVNVVLAALVLFLIIIRRRHPVRARLPREVRDATVVTSTIEDDPSKGSDLDRGVQAIRRTDTGFEPTRFAGYAGMTFRDVQTAWMIQDIGPLRQRLTSEMYDGLQAQCERLRSTRRSNRVEEMEIQAEVTEAWQESGRDYVTAYVAGSMVDYLVDGATGNVLDGSRTMPRAVEEFWTFVRPSGLTFWMLSAIQTA